MKEAILAIVSLVIGFFLSRMKSVLDSRRDAKNDFRMVVSVRKGRIPQKGFVEFHETTKTEIRDAVSRLMPFLRCYEIKPVEMACAAYGDIEDGSLDDEHECDLRREALAKDKLPVPDKPSDILRTRLDKLYDSVT